MPISPPPCIPAARALRYGFPAIAASIGYRFTQEEMKNKWPGTHKHWPDYMVTVVDKLNVMRQHGEADDEPGIAGTHDSR